jgi:glycosyltransferase involved in cell wall biosynthesis
VSVSSPLRIFVPHASDTFTNHRAHGDGLVAFEVASRLAARGHDVHVLSPLIDVRGTLPASLHLHPVDVSGHGIKARLAYVRAVRSTYARLRTRAPFDIIHQLNPVYAGMSLALADARVPVVLGAYVGAWPRSADSADIMGAIDLPLASLARRAVVGLQQRRAAALILSTPAARELIVDWKAVEQKCVTIPHGIDPAPYNAPEPGGDPADGPPTILFLGGTERRKGIYVLLEAFARVRAARPDVRLLIAGGGGREGEVMAVVEKMPDRAAIAFLGVVERAAVPALMRGITVFAAPSLGEPFGMALLEAMASAKPVVVTDAGGPRYIVDARGGRKVPVEDPVALADALLEVLQSPERARAMGAYNRRAVETTYAWDRVIEKIEAVYASVLA